MVSLLLTLNIFHTLFSSVSIVNFEQLNACWAMTNVSSNSFKDISSSG